MDADELQRIRQARIAEMQAQAGSGGGPSSAGGRGGGSNGQAPSAEEQAAQREQDANNRFNMLSQILDQAARDRLRRIAIVKPDRARGVEDLVIRMAQSGQVRQRITEPELVGLLEEIAGQEGARQQTKIINARRRDLDDSDEDWN